MSLELLSVDNIQEIAKEYGYLAVFLGIALENTGIPIPGETITVVGGFLAGSGELNYWIVLISSIAGAVLGDNFGYWLGKFGGWQFLVKIAKLFRVSDHQLEEAKVQFTKNAPRAVFFGRFVALLRIFAGPMAGIVEMPYKEFILCNLGGAALWASVTVTLSYFLGRLIPLHEVLSWMSRLGLVALIVIIIGFGVVWWLENRQGKKYPEKINPLDH